MKKNILLLALVLLGFVAAEAQVTITNSVFPGVGDVLRTRQPTSLGFSTMTAPGPNQTWDYSSMSGGDSTVVTVTAASTGTFGSLFTNADIILETSILPGENYLSNSGNSLAIEGFAGDILGIGVVVPAVFSDPLELLQTPMSYQDTVTDVSAFTVEIKVSDFPDLVSYLNDTLGFGASGITVDSLRVLYTATTGYRADAWGNLTVPQSGSFDVLRIKQTINADLQAEFKGTFASIPFDWTNPSAIPNAPPIDFLGPSTTINFFFYSNNQKEAILIAEMNPNNPNNVSEATYKTSPATSVFGFGSVRGNVPTISAFPNPVIETLNLKMGNFSSGDYQVKVYNIIGRELMSETRFISGNETISLDVSNLQRGTYLYSVQDAKGNTLVTRRIMVVRP